MALRFSSAGFRYGAGRRTSNAFSVEVQNAKLVRDILTNLENQMESYIDSRGNVRVRSARDKFWRDESKKIAEKVVIPQLKRTARSSPTKAARAVAETARAKSDRLVVVQVGQATPALSGFKLYRRSADGGKGPKSDNARWKTSVAWGTEFGPKGGARTGKHANMGINYYGQPRNEAGYWVTPAIQNSIPEATRRYSELIRQLFERYGKYR